MIDELNNFSIEDPSWRLTLYEHIIESFPLNAPLSMMTHTAECEAKKLLRLSQQKHTYFNLELVSRFVQSASEPSAADVTESGPGLGRGPRVMLVTGGAAW